MKTSVALTTYNGREYIYELLDSLMNQTVKADEVIIIDDVSTDGTDFLVEEYIRKNKLPWQLYRNEQNIGWRRNFRIAMKKTCNELVFLCDQDDIWQIDKIEVMKSVMKKHNEIELLASNYYVKNVKGYDLLYRFKIDQSCSRNDGSITRLKSIKCITNVLRPGCTFCVRRRLIDVLNTYDDDNFGHDNILWHIAYGRSSLFLLNNRLITYRLHKGHASEYDEGRTMRRRLDEIEGFVKVGKFLQNYCEKQNYKTVENVTDMVEFQKERKRVIEDGTYFELIKFQHKNKRYYFRVTSMLMDLISKHNDNRGQ